MKKYFLDLKVKGSADDIRGFLKLCGLLQYCCNIGTSREIVCSVDGDGSAGLSFEVKFGDKDTFVDLESTKFDTGKKPPIIYIGE